jgi:hypothetical protein
VAATSLFSIFLIIAMVTAMLRSLEGLGCRPADGRALPEGDAQRSPRVLDAGDRHLLHLALLLADPGRAADRRRPRAGGDPAGLRPLAAGFTVAIAGQGMALSSDYVIRVAPGLSATAANADPSIVADRAFVLSLIVGGIALAIGYAMESGTCAGPSDEWLDEWEDAADRGSPTADAEEIVDLDGVA